MSNARDKANIPALNFSSTGIDDNATSTAITINSSEQVGIGTTAPSRTLTVSGSTAPILALVETGTSGSSSVFFGDSSADNVGKIQYLHSSNDLAFTVNASERMRIDSSGNLLLNTTSQVSSAKLSLNGSIGLDRTSTYNQQWLQFISHTGTSNYGTLNFTPLNGQTTAGFKVNDAANNNRFQIRGSGDSIKETVINESGGNFDFRVEGTSDTNLLFVDAGSNRVGIGEGVPSRKLQVIDTNSVVSVKTSNDTYSSVFFGDTSADNVGKVLYDHTNDSLQIQVNSGERMRIDSSGNVGIGTSSPTLPLEVSGSGLFGGSIIATGSTTTTNSRRAIMTHDGSSMIFKASGDSTNRNIVFERSGDGSADETMRIESTGNVGLGKKHSDANNVSGIKFYAIGLQYMYAPASTQIMRFYDSGTGTQAGSISITSSATAYNTSSDYRLKENVSYDFDATSRLKQLKPARFNFIADANTTVDGFLAHEVSSVVPEAISGTKDAVDENGNPEYQGIDQSKLVPLLVKTIQELEARITALETNNP